MIQYHFGLGLHIRNAWGLWSNSRLSKHMRRLGFTHADDMSGVILDTFWCKRHGQDFHISDRAAKYASYWESAQKAETEEKARVENAQSEMRHMMIGLKLERRGPPPVHMPDRIDRSLRARFLSPHRDGILIAIRRNNDGGDDDFTTEAYFFDPKDRKLHPVRVPELQEVHAVVKADDTAWFAGVRGGAAVLLGVTDEKHTTIPLPQDDKPPQLGLDRQKLLAIYGNTVFRLEAGGWQLIHSGTVSLPRSGPPPELHGNHLFFRDEGRGESHKRLWWLTIGQGSGLTSLDRDVGIIGSHGPRWENSFSYAVTQDGSLWACVGEGYARKSLLRRSAEGRYSIAIMNNSIEFTPDLFGSEETDQGLSVSAVSGLSDGRLLLVGDSGLYVLKGAELSQELAFTNTNQRIPTNGGKNVYHWGWVPSNVVCIGEDSYFISGAFGGIYLLCRGGAGQWELVSLDEHLGDAVTW